MSYLKLYFGDCGQTRLGFVLTSFCRENEAHLHSDRNYGYPGYLTHRCIKINGAELHFYEIQENGVGFALIAVGKDKTIVRRAVHALIKTSKTKLYQRSILRSVNFEDTTLLEFRDSLEQRLRDMHYLGQDIF